MPQLEALCEIIASRVENVDPNAVESTRTELVALLELWSEAAAGLDRLKYKDYAGHKKGVGESLLIAAGDTQSTQDISLDTSEVPWPTLMSLRDVDAESQLRLISTSTGSKK